MQWVFILLLYAVLETCAHVFVPHIAIPGKDYYARKPVRIMHVKYITCPSYGLFAR